jgi:hypothetical protein
MYVALMTVKETSHLNLKKCHPKNEAGYQGDQMDL